MPQNYQFIKTLHSTGQDGNLFIQTQIFLDLMGLFHLMKQFNFPLEIVISFRECPQ